MFYFEEFEDIASLWYGKSEDTAGIQKTILSESCNRALTFCLSFPISILRNQSYSKEEIVKSVFSLFLKDRGDLGLEKVA